MIDYLLFGLTLGSAVGCGLIAGVFFAFSAFVMKALVRLPAAQGITAMQSINIAVINPPFLAVFVGTAGTCALLLVSALAVLHGPVSYYLIAGSLLYLVGVIMVTRACNVPRNDALAAVEVTSSNHAMLWSQFVHGWMIWNHARTAAAAAVAILLTIALREINCG